MANEPAPKAAAGQLPRIGELIEKATGVKFDSYKDAQQKLQVEVAMAAIASNPDYRSPEGKTMGNVVNDLLLKQADMRMTAVKKDADILLAGQKLDALPNSSFLMVKIADKAPAGLEATLEHAKEGVKDPAWLRAEGASNATNFARDVLTTANSAPSLDEKQKKTIEEGIKAGGIIADALVTGKPLDQATQLAQTHRLEKAMDEAIAANPAIQQSAGYKANYETGRYREAMREGITKGLEAVTLQHAAELSKGVAAQLRESVSTPAPDASASLPPLPDQKQGKGL